MTVGCPRQSIKTRGRARVPSSTSDVLTRHLEHVTASGSPTDLHDLPTLAEGLDTVPDPRSRRGRPTGSAGAIYPRSVEQRLWPAVQGVKSVGRLRQRLRRVRRTTGERHLGSGFQSSAHSSRASSRDGFRSAVSQESLVSWSRRPARRRSRQATRPSDTSRCVSEALLARPAGNSLLPAGLKCHDAIARTRRKSAVSD